MPRWFEAIRSFESSQSESHLGQLNVKRATLGGGGTAESVGKSGFECSALGVLPVSSGSLYSAGEALEKARNRYAPA